MLNRVLKFLNWFSKSNSIEKSDAKYWLYHMPGCAACEIAMEQFKKANIVPEKINCSEKQEKCMQMGIFQFPTIYFKDERKTCEYNRRITKEELEKFFNEFYNPKITFIEDNNNTKLEDLYKEDFSYLEEKEIEIYTTEEFLIKNKALGGMECFFDKLKRAVKSDLNMLRMKLNGKILVIQMNSNTQKNIYFNQEFPVLVEPFNHHILQRLLIKGSDIVFLVPEVEKIEKFNKEECLESCKKLASEKPEGANTDMEGFMKQCEAMCMNQEDNLIFKETEKIEKIAKEFREKGMERPLQIITLDPKSHDDLNIMTVLGINEDVKALFLNYDFNKSNDPMTKYVWRVEENGKYEWLENFISDSQKNLLEKYSKSEKEETIEEIAEREKNGNFVNRVTGKNMSSFLEKEGVKVILFYPGIENVEKSEDEVKAKDIAESVAKKAIEQKGDVKVTVGKYCMVKNEHAKGPQETKYFFKVYFGKEVKDYRNINEQGENGLIGLVKEMSKVDLNETSAEENEDL